MEGGETSAASAPQVVHSSPASATAGAAAAASPEDPPALALALAATSISEGDAVEGTGGSTIQTAAAQACSTDALGVILSFLPLVDVVSSAGTCHRWSTGAAAASAASGVGRHAITVTSLHQLRAIAASPVRTLVRAIHLLSPTIVVDESVWAAFPHLTALTWTIDSWLLSTNTTLHFPTTIRTLDITVTIRDTEYLPCFWWSLDALLSAVVRCPLTRLRVAIPPVHVWSSWRRREARPAPNDTINQLLALRDTITDLELQLNWAYLGIWQSDHITVFRSLTHLTRLHISNGEWYGPGFEMLMAEPVTLTHLRSLELDGIGSDQSTSLSRLPSLSSLRHLSLFDWSDVAALAHLRRVETAGIDVYVDWREQTLPNRTELTAALGRCTNLTDLTLKHLVQSEVTPAAVHDLLTPLSRLRTLKLWWVKIDLADFASVPHLADTLEHLSISHAQSLQSLLHLRSLRRLQSAHIKVDLGEIDIREPPPIELAQEENETVFLPSLEQLKVFVRGFTSSPIGCIFGRLPALRRVGMRSGPITNTTGDWFDENRSDLGNSRGDESRGNVHLGHGRGRLAPLLPLLARMTTTCSELTLEDRRLDANDLASVVSPMTHLRELHVDKYIWDLSFLSSASQLAPTLERLTIEGLGRNASSDVADCDLRYLRPFEALRYLKFNLRFAYADKDARAQPVVLPNLRSLRELHFTVPEYWYDPTHAVEYGKREPPPKPKNPFFNFSLLGPMPELRKAVIRCDGRLDATSIAFTLARCSRLTDLQLHNPALLDANLTSALQPLTRLRSLDVDSAALDGLSFASTATHLADTLERLRLRRPRTVNVTLAVSELQHLHALTNLRTLEVDLCVVDPRPDATDEFDMSKPTFRRDRWPHLLASSACTRPCNPHAEKSPDWNWDPQYR